MAKNFPEEDFKFLKALIEANILEKIYKDYNSQLNDISFRKLSTYLDRELKLEEDWLKIRLMALSLDNGQTISVFECLKLDAFKKQLDERKVLKPLKEDQKNVLASPMEESGKNYDFWVHKDRPEEFFKLNLVLNGKTLDSIELGLTDLKLSLDLDQTDFKIKLLSEDGDFILDREFSLEDLFYFDEGDSVGSVMEDLETRSLGSSEELSKEIDQDLLS